MFIPSCFIGFVISVSEYFPHSSDLLMPACRKQAICWSYIYHLTKISCLFSIVWKCFVSIAYSLWSLITQIQGRAPHTDVYTHTPAGITACTVCCRANTALQAQCLLRPWYLSPPATGSPASPATATCLSWLRLILHPFEALPPHLEFSVKAVISNSTKSKLPFLCHSLDSLV